MINDMQIRFFINEFTIKTNERITIDDLIDANLINHEYIERNFLFNRIFMQQFFYILW
jgi:hypothetical protein